MMKEPSAFGAKNAPNSAARVLTPTKPDARLSAFARLVAAVVRCEVQGALPWAAVPGWGHRESQSKPGINMVYFSRGTLPTERALLRVSGQNPGLRCSYSQNHASRSKKPDFRSYLWQGGSRDPGPAGLFSFPRNAPKAGQIKFRTACRLSIHGRTCGLCCLTLLLYGPLGWTGS